MRRPHAAIVPADASYGVGSGALKSHRGTPVEWSLSRKVSARRRQMFVYSWAPERRAANVNDSWEAEGKDVPHCAYP